MKLGVKVPVIESERGWGSKVDDHMICLSVEDAKAFITEFNAKNTEKEVPDWYMYAENSTRPIDLTDEQYAIIEATEKKRIWLSSLNSKMLIISLSQSRYSDTVIEIMFHSLESDWFTALFPIDEVKFNEMKEFYIGKEYYEVKKTYEGRIFAEAGI